VLPKKARLTTSEDFAKATKSGLRLTSENLVGYLYISPVANLSVNIEQSAKCGLIINKSVGGSVMRHRIARQLRHDLAPIVNTLPANSLFVVRVLKNAPGYTNELSQLVSGLLSRSQKNVSR
jgi:ribonuclease P protein component